MLKITPDITISEKEIDESFIQSGGPGGQNVNKVATAVQLRFNIASSKSLTPETGDRLRRLAGSRLTNDGDLVITSRRFRTQEANRNDARIRLASLISQASREPRKRHATRPTRASDERRLQSKAKQSALKRYRTNRLTNDP